jgi:ubiquinone/menaquinone biosynthesis C-methylase UbiE
MIPRVLEAEVMDTAQEADDYDMMDHAAVNDSFCEDFLAFCRQVTPGKTSGGAALRVLDVGTGTARIPIRLCTLAPNAAVEGVDLSEAMLAIARTNVDRAKLDGRVTLRLADAKNLGGQERAFDAVICNTIVHHIPEPGAALAEMWRVTAPGGVLFVRDLVRPESKERLDELVALHAGSPASPSATAVASFERQRALFAASLEASLTVDELRALVAPLGIPPAAVGTTSDRHWTLATVRAT